MTQKEAVIKSLEDLAKGASSNEICNHIIEKQYFSFTEDKTPRNTIATVCGDFIRKGDSRVKRTKQGGSFLYYLTKDEPKLNFDIIYPSEDTEVKKSTFTNTYEERSLHKLLSSFLKTSNTFSKTIFHEQSNKGKDNNQIWTHPDMIGIQFLNLQNKASRNLHKAINKLDTFKISSYEIKKEINSDNELKQAFFQAVSNSSWANYGYLVAFEFSDNLFEEIERLNQSFGIGVIELNANAYQSKILFQPKYHGLDFKTIDKLCKMNREFEKFVEQVEKLMMAEEKYYQSTEKELNEICDPFFLDDTDMEGYCKAKGIPFE